MRKGPAVRLDDAERDVGVEDLAYDLLLEDDGGSLLCDPALNDADGNVDAARDMLLHPYTVRGLGDGAAHCGVCDGTS